MADDPKRPPDDAADDSLSVVMPAGTTLTWPGAALGPFKEETAVAFTVDDGGDDDAPEDDARALPGKDRP